MTDATPVSAFDYALLKVAIRMACAETPTARIAAGQATVGAPRNRAHREADRLVSLFAGAGASSGQYIESGSFNRFTANGRR
ncbi:hypothetical protein [Aquisediminimonas sediminicola]|uniref:hypothetical protein n=1 Tax=Alteraquisediminimonas sediminicola TaxID=2676787 RepID=UPI001C8E8A4F|nr:hypothetical protein [Aquisediminimonas sediminicola]